MIFAFADCELDTGLLELRKAGRPVHVEPQVFDVIAYLVQNHQRAVPKDELLDHIWPDHYISEAALNSRVMAARKAIGDNGKDQRLIKTIHGRGYRFIGDVTEGDGKASRPVLSAPASEAPLPSRPTSRPGTVRGLEPPATSFVGRADDLARLLNTLESTNCRLLTIVGPGGVGKTRLAMEAARRLGEHGREVVYVSVESVTQPEQLPSTVAAGIGISLRGEGDSADLLGSLADREMVLVLDNFEQLTSEGTELLSEIAQAAPGVKLLLTSRIVLGLREEWVFPIGGLTFEGEDNPEAAILFLERQEQANAASGQVDSEAVAEICRLTAGMPLAIELAAALTRYFSQRQIADQIAREVDVLRADLKNVPVRHRSVPGLLEESVRHLTVEQMRALLSLSVFEGSFSARAAEAVAEASFPTIAVLVDHSLVQPREDRFAIHPLMRQFARERLGDAIAETQARHAEYFSRFVAERRDDLEGGRQVEAGEEIQKDLPNIVAAWRRACEAANTELLAAAAYPLMLHLQQRSRFVESAELVRTALASLDAEQPGQRELAAALNVHLAWARLQVGRPGEVFHAAMGTQRLYASGEAPVPSGMGTDPRTTLAVMNWGGGDYRRAFNLALAAADDAKARGDGPGAAFALWIAGATRFRQIEVAFDRESQAYHPLDGASLAALAETRALIEEAAGILSERRERWIRSNVEIERGVQASATGNMVAAQEYYETALGLRRELGDEHGTALALVYVADNLIDLDRIDEAVPLQEEALDLFRRNGDSGGMSEIERSLGHAAYRRGDFEASRRHFRRSLEIAVRMSYTNNTISCVRGLAELWCAEGDERCLPVSAKVAEHEASTPFTRARANAILAGAPAKKAASAREWAREHGLEDAVALVMEG